MLAALDLETRVKEDLDKYSALRSKAHLERLIGEASDVGLTAETKELKVALWTMAQLQVQSLSLSLLFSYICVITSPPIMHHPFWRLVFSCHQVEEDTLVLLTNAIKSNTEDVLRSVISAAETVGLSKSVEMEQARHTLSLLGAQHEPLRIKLAIAVQVLSTLPLSFDLLLSPLLYLPLSLSIYIYIYIYIYIDIV